MQQIEYKKSYQEYKEELDAELNKTAEGFVRIGYLLKVARDTDILKESGYQSVTEFAKEEYGIDKSQVSRFIHINDKFAEGGYSDRLQEQYQGFGYAKLTLMLQLPNAVNETLSPAYSKAEIQIIKEEVDAEHQVTNLERMMENVPMSTPQEEGSLLKSTIYKIGEDEPELYCAMAAVQSIRELQETMAPAGEKTYIVRIPGIGRLMLMLSDSSDVVAIVNIRTGEKESVSWEAMYSAWQQLLEGDGSQEHWEKTYCKEYPKKEPVAPVQQKKTTERSKKVVKSKPEKPGKGIKSESEPSVETEERKDSVSDNDVGITEKEERCKKQVVEESEDEDELLCDECKNASGLTGNPDLCANCGPNGRNYEKMIWPMETDSEKSEGKYEEQIKQLVISVHSVISLISESLCKKRNLDEYRKIKIQVNKLNDMLSQLIKYIDLTITEEENNE